MVGFVDASVGNPVNSVDNSVGSSVDSVDESVRDLDDSSCGLLESIVKVLGELVVDTKEASVVCWSPVDLPVIAFIKSVVVLESNSVVL